MGIPAHGPVGSGKLRETPGESDGAPNVPVGPRVSTIRQGVTGSNPISCPMSANALTPDDPPECVTLEPTDQFGTVAPSWPRARAEKRKPARTASKTVLDRHRSSRENLIAASLDKVATQRGVFRIALPRSGPIRPGPFRHRPERVSNHRLRNGGLSPRDPLRGPPAPSRRRPSS